MIIGNLTEYIVNSHTEVIFTHHGDEENKDGLHLKYWCCYGGRASEFPTGAGRFVSWLILLHGKEFVVLKLNYITSKNGDRPCLTGALK